MREKTADSESQREVASNGSVSSSAVAGGSRRFSLYLQSVAQISGVATIIAATVYALGVFTLVLPVSTSYSSTFPAAWYAVSVVPKTVVVGHGMKSLLWPSLALTVATTMFALTVLWVLYSVSAGWRHARATAETPALSPLSMVKIYAFLSVVTVAILLAVSGALLGWEATWSGGYAEAGIGVYVVDVVLGWAFFSAAGLCVLSYLTAAVFLIARWLRGTSRLIRSRSVPSVSFRGFIYKGLAFAVVSSVFFSMAGILSGGVFDLLHPEYADMATYPEGSLPTLFFWPLSLTLVLVALFGLAAALYLMLRLLRYARKAHLISEAMSSNFTPLVAPLRGLSASLVQRARMLTPTLLYSMVLFLVLYLAVFIAANTLSFVVFLTDEVRGEIKSESILDNILIPLVILSALVSGALMYWKDWKGLGRGERDHLSQGSWLSVSRDLLKGIGSRTLRSGLLWSLGAAYVFALVWAFLLAQLNEPPLPKVEVNGLSVSESGQVGKKPDFQGKELVLLAHTEGYWYLIDEDERDLLVVPDRTDKLIRLQLDEQP